MLLESKTHYDVTSSDEQQHKHDLLTKLEEEKRKLIENFQNVKMNFYELRRNGQVTEYAREVALKEAEYYETNMLKIIQEIETEKSRVDDCLLDSFTSKDDTKSRIIEVKSTDSVRKQLKAQIRNAENVIATLHAKMVIHDRYAQMNVANPQTLKDERKLIKEKMDGAEEKLQALINDLHKKSKDDVNKSRIIEVKSTENAHKQVSVNEQHLKRENKEMRKEIKKANMDKHELLTKLRQQEMKHEEEKIQMENEIATRDQQMKAAQSKILDLCKKLLKTQHELRHSVAECDATNQKLQEEMQFNELLTKEFKLIYNKESVFKSNQWLVDYFTLSRPVGKIVKKKTV